MRRKGILIGVLLVLAVLLFYPTVVNEGSKEGLMLWFTVVLPALLPFMVFSGVMMRMGVTSVIGRLIYPFAHRILKLTENGCYVLTVGWLSGYPLGAKTAAALYQSGDISRQEAQYLLVFCNNASPMFLLEYIGVYCLGLDEPLRLLVVVYLSAVINAFLYKKCYGYYHETEYVVKYHRSPHKKCSIMTALDESILDSFVTVTKVGGYIILFAIMAQFVEKALPCHQSVKLLGLGIIEITTGGEYLKAYEALAWQKWILAAAFAAFGGFSSVAQTFSVLHETDLSMKNYLIAKVWHSLLAALIAGLFLL